MTKTNGKWDENLPSFVRCFPFDDDDDDDNIGGFLLVWQCSSGINLFGVKETQVVLLQSSKIQGGAQEGLYSPTSYL